MIIDLEQVKAEHLAAATVSSGQVRGSRIEVLDWDARGGKMKDAGVDLVVACMDSNAVPGKPFMSFGFYAGELPVPVLSD